MSAPPPIQPRQPGEPRALSFAQEGLWYLDQLIPNSSAYNVAYRARLTGPLDIPVFQKSIHSVVERHEPLRTVFVVSGGKPVPFPLKNSRAELQQADFRRIPVEQREAEASRFIQKEAARPFNLSRDSMFRPSLLRLAEEDFIFVHVAPHIVFEGGSVGVLYRDLAAFYNGGAPLALTVEYGDFALWQRRHLTGERLEPLAQFWRQQLNGAPIVDLPADFPRPPIYSAEGARHHFSMPPDLLNAANRFFRAAKTTAYRGLYAAFNVFLYCRLGQTDLCVSSPFAPLNPRCPGLQDLIGYFVNTVALRAQFSPTNTFRELLKIVDLVLWEAVTHSDLTFGKVVEAVQPPRDPSRPTLTQVNFRAPKQPHPSLQLNGILAGRAEYVDTGSAKFDLALEIESSTGEGCYFEYCTGLFREDTVLRMKRDYLDLLAALIAAPDMPLSELVAARGLRRW